MKKIHLLIIPAAVLLAAGLALPALSLHEVEVRPADNLTFEFHENLMFRDERTSYPMKGRVVEMKNETIPLGIAGQTNELDFGRIILNSTSRKVINMNSAETVKVEFYSAGNISDYIVMPEDFFMRGGNEVKVTFNGTSLGNFTGTLMVRSVIPKNFLAEKMMGLV